MSSRLVPLVMVYLPGVERTQQVSTYRLGDPPESVKGQLSDVAAAAPHELVSALGVPQGPLPEWRNGRRSGLKIHRGQPRASSTLASGIVHPQRLRCSSSGHAAWHFTAILPLVVPPKCLHVGSSYPDNAGGQEAICELFSGERSWSYGPRSLLVNSEQSSVVGWVPRRSRQFHTASLRSR